MLSDIANPTNVLLLQKNVAKQNVESSPCKINLYLIVYFTVISILSCKGPIFHFKAECTNLKIDTEDYNCLKCIILFGSYCRQESEIGRELSKNKRALERIRNATVRRLSALC